MLRVLFVTHYSSFYGANRSMLFLANDLKLRYGVESHILVVDKLVVGKRICVGELHNRAELLGIPVTEAWYCPWMVKHEAYPLWKFVVKFLLSEMFFFPCFNKRFDAQHFDLIHCNTSVSDLGARLAIKHKKPFVWHIREFGKADYNLDYIFPKKKVEKTYRAASQIIAISKSIEESFLSEFELKNVAVISNGLESIDIPKVFSPVRQFCCVGLLSENKNQLEILRAGKLLIDSGITAFNINLFGDGTQVDRAILETFVKVNCLEDNVKFWGYQDNMLQHWGNMQVGIMSSKKEAFGRVTVEYMMAKMPVIGTNTGGTPEIIDENETGYLYELGNIEQLAEYMKRYIVDDELVDTHGENAYRRAQEHFSLESNTDKIYSVYKRVLDL